VPLFVLGASIYVLLVHPRDEATIVEAGAIILP
jgi:hypothetical protein